MKEMKNMMEMIKNALKKNIFKILTYSIFVKICLTISGIALAITVIGRVNPTYPINKYIDPVMPSSKNLNIKELKDNIPNAPNNINKTIKFPIESPGMAPGVIKRREISLPQLIKPIFLIGSDTHSIEWLKNNKERLLQNNAIGLLVQAVNQQDADLIKKIAGEITILPMSGESIGQKLKIKNYPVLITRNYIEQ